MSYKMISVNVDKRILDNIHKIMDTEIIDEDDIVRFQMHKGSKQQWYRELLEEGLNSKIALLNQKRKEFNNEV